MKKIMLVAVVVFALGAMASQATVLTPVLADGADHELYGNGSGVWVGQSTSRTGADSAARPGNSYVAVFALPTLPAGETIASASFEVNVVSQNGPFGGDPVWNIDLYGIRANNSSTVDVNADFFIGANDGGATKVEDNFFLNLANAVSVGAHSSSAPGATALGTWLQGLYTGSTPNASYAFMRMNSDMTQADGLPAGRYVTITSGNGSSNQPSLTITTAVIPEPATAGILGLGALIVMMARRRIRK